MLSVHRSDGKSVWVDLCEPTDVELAQACADYGLAIPSRAELEEIEFSSRLQYEDGVFTISVPVTPHTEAGDVPSPLGFVLTRDLLVTIRFAQFKNFPAIIKRVERRPRAAADIFLVILEALVDYGADRLEDLRGEAQGISNRVFHNDNERLASVAKTSKNLKAILIQIGRIGERLSHIRDTLLVLQRAVPFIAEHGGDWIEDEVRSRLKTAGSDVQSLNDYEVHLTDKIQFLLDAALGFINTEQNDIFRVLTIASVIGIPPTFVASLYGMNFHNMPELSWTYGYQWGLFVIVVSTVIPIMWFKIKGWW